ncbi:hypothetical protein H4S01_004441, partial [Coemansia sp. RSA 2610]
MLGYVRLLLALCLCACLVRADDKQAVSGYRGALLVKNGKQTSCEIALIDATSGFVAATCVVDGAGNLDTTARYEAYSDTGKGSSSMSAPILSGSIHVHPQFSMATFANNIAIVQFTLNPDIAWTIRVAVDHGTWAGTKYVRRYMSDLASKAWATPDERIDGDMARPQCAASSGLYAANYFDFSCSTATAPTMVGSQCGVPYGSLYGLIGNKMAVGGIYSHSVVTGSDLCGSSKTVHYYTLLSNFIAFAQNTLGRGVLTLSTDAFSVQADVNYGMEPEAFAPPQGTRVIAGNAFNRDAGEAMVTATEAAQQPSANVQTDAASQPANTQQQQQQSQPQQSAPANADVAAGDAASAQTASSGADSNEGDSSSSRGGSATTARNPEDDGDAPTLVSLSDGSAVISMDSQDARPTGSSASGGSSNPENTNASEDAPAAERTSKKLRGGQIAAIVICLTLFCILAAVGGFFGLRWYREYRIKKWSPDAVQQILESHIADNEMGNARPPTA